VWGQARWITVTFILFGVFTAFGSGFDALFRPAERSSKFARMGFEYEVLRDELFDQAQSLMRQGPKDATEDLARQIKARFRTLKEKEVDLYVTGPVNMVDPVKEKGQKKLWRRFSG
jgi:hypothetical protein